MDPSIMKKLLEDDEDESMHSGADVDAFQAELNRDIGGDLPPSLPSSASDSAVMSQASNNISGNYQIQQDQNIPRPQEVTSSEKEVAKQQQQQPNNTSQESRDLPLAQMQPQEDRQLRPAEQTPHQIPQAAVGLQVPGKSHEPERAHNPDSESQYQKLQKMSNQQATVSEQASAPSARGKQVPFGMLLPVLMSQLDKDKGMQLQELFGKLKKEEISKESFVRLIRGVVGEQVLRLAVVAVQSQLQSQASARKQAPGAPSVSSGPSQQTLPSSKVQPNEFPSSHHTLPSSKVQPHPNPSHPIKTDSHGMQVSQTRSADQVRDSNKMQQRPHPHFSQGPPFAAYGGTNSQLYPGTNVSASTLAPRPHLHPHPHPHPHPHESHMRQMPHHQNMGSGGETQYGVKLERPTSIAHFGGNSTNQQNPSPWQPPTNRDQSSGAVPSLSYVKPEPADNSTELQHKLPPSASVSATHVEHGSMSSRDDSFEKRPPTMGFSNSANMVTSSSTSMPPPNPVSSSVTMQHDSNIPLGPRAPTGASSTANIVKTPPKKPSVGQKKPLEAIGSSPPPASKKQKVSGNFLDQSIEQLNDVTAVSGVNLREEEEQLFSLPKEDSRASEATRKAVQEEEERLILQKTPLQKKLAEIMAKCGLKNIGNDVERCLSLSVEERMRGLIDNLIRLSKQRVDVEKARHNTITTSDIRHQIMTMNRKAKDEWEKKQAEEEKIRKQNDPESSNGVDGEKEKDEGRGKSSKMLPNKEEDDKMRTTAANVAARAAAGGDDMLSKWQLMAEQARQKREGGSDSAPSKDSNRKSSTASGRTAKDYQDAEKRSVSASGGVRKFGKNQVTGPQTTTVARAITVKDVVAVLEREPQMSKSTLIYRLYDKIRSDSTAE